MSLTPYAEKSESTVARGDSKPVGVWSCLQDARAKIAQMAGVVKRTALLLLRFLGVSNY
jgi:hypothetical protein